MMDDLRGTDLFRLEDRLWILQKETKSPAYDFGFGQFFSCRRARGRTDGIKAVARVGALPDYRHVKESLAGIGVDLVNSPDQHSLASDLPSWYPKLEELTPKSLWSKKPITAEVVERELGWPVFVKGARQTSRHRADLSIAKSPGEYEALLRRYSDDSILHWQQVVVREYVDLRPVRHERTNEVPASFEFRTFWWHGVLVGAGAYWTGAGVSAYDWTTNERAAALEVAEAAVHRLAVPFVVVDIAQTQIGEWIVIECNDAQESGYAGVSPFGLWQNVIAEEVRRSE